MQTNSSVVLCRQLAMVHTLCMCQQRSLQQDHQYWSASVRSKSAPGHAVRTTMHPEHDELVVARFGSKREAMHTLGKAQKQGQQQMRQCMLALT